MLTRLILVLLLLQPVAATAALQHPPEGSCVRLWQWLAVVHSTLDKDHVGERHSRTIRDRPLFPRVVHRFDYGEGEPAALHAWFRNGCLVQWDDQVSLGVWRQVIGATR